MFRSLHLEKLRILDLHNFITRQTKNPLRFSTTTTNDTEIDGESSQSAWERIDDPSKYRGLIPLKKLEISYTTSSGPGGQNVNKNCTKAEVRFRVDECDWINSPIRERFFDQHKHRITNDGYLVIRSERTRHQSFNLTDCLEKLRTSIRQIQKDAKDEEDAKPTEDELLIMKKKQEYAAKRRIQEKRFAGDRKREKKLDDF